MDMEEKYGRPEGRSRRLLVVPVLLALVVGLVGFGVWHMWFRPTPISQVLTRAGDLHGREVRISGLATEGGSLFGHGAYSVQDRTGKIWVLTAKGCPPLGKPVRVKGRVNTFLQMPAVLRSLLPVKIDQLVGLEEVERS